MSIDSTPANASSAEGFREAPVGSVAPPSWPWQRAALLLAGAAQLITISTLVGADPIAVTWSSLLLAIAPAPGRRRGVRPGAGQPAGRGGRDRRPGGWCHRADHPHGAVLRPALVVLAVGAVRLWREQRLTAGEGVGR
jgi:hypothetical protein